MNVIFVCGIPGAGKSTVVKNLLEQMPATIVLSSDALRAVYGKSEDDQTVSGVVFLTMKYLTRYFLRQGRDIIVDATNVLYKNRKNILDEAKGFENVFKMAIVLDVSLETAKLQNSQRERKVPEWVLEKMHKEFQMPKLGEFDRIEHWQSLGEEYVKTFEF